MTELAGGMGPSRVGGTKRFAWKKFAVCTVFFDTHCADVAFWAKGAYILVAGGWEH